MVFEVIFLFKSFVTCVFKIRQDAPAEVVVEAVPPPFRRYPLDKVADDAVSVHPFHPSEITVDTGREVADVRYARVAVPPANLPEASVDYGVVYIDAVDAERRADELAALCIVLAIALVLVHLIAVFVPKFPPALGDMVEPLLFVGEYPPHIIDKAAIMYTAGIDLPMVEVVKVVVLRHLPMLVAEGCAVAEVKIEGYALMFRNERIPHPARTFLAGMDGRIAPRCSQQDIEQVIADLALLDVALDKRAVVVV